MRTAARKVRPDELNVGAPLPHTLRTRAGRLLAHGGTVLTEAMAGALASGDPDSPPELIFDTRVDVWTGDARDGVVGAVLPVVGVRIEELDTRANERRLARVRADLRRAGAAFVLGSRQRWENLPRGVTVGLDPIPIDDSEPGPGAVPSPIERLLRVRRDAGVLALRSLLARLLDGERIGIEALAEIADDLADAVSRHPTMYAIIAMGLPRPADSLPDHAFTVGALALGMAARLGWARSDARAVAVTGFLCDVGMGLVPHPVRQAARPLTEIELNAVRRHPEHAVALLRNVRGLPESVVLSVYQHHERCDGSGYPTGLHAEQMHDYARLVAAADAFAGMTAPRAHRPALTAQAAISELAHLAAAGAFDASAVRALLDALGLYPAGSFVKLSSGHVAVVSAGAKPGTPDRPTVHVVQPEGSASPYGCAIDLSRIEPEQLRVVEAVRAP